MPPGAREVGVPVGMAHTSCGQQVEGLGRWSGTGTILWGSAAFSFAGPEAGQARSHPAVTSTCPDRAGPVTERAEAGTSQLTLSVRPGNLEQPRSWPLTEALGAHRPGGLRNGRLALSAELHGGEGRSARGTHVTEGLCACGVGSSSAR